MLIEFKRKRLKVENNFVVQKRKFIALWHLYFLSKKLFLLNTFVSMITWVSVQ